MTLTSHGESLLDLARSANRELVLCAPFAKSHVIQRVLDVIDAGVNVRLITRWRPEEVAAGVSDVSVLRLISGRGDVILHDRLHAKYFRSEANVLLGSANLTGAALGWAAPGNIELLVSARLGDVLEMESILLREGVTATEEIALSIAARAAELPPAPIEELLPEHPVTHDWSTWLPRLRDPRDLYRAYGGAGDTMTVTSAAAARLDLAFLDLPTGLERDEFTLLVGSRLLQHPVIAGLDDLLERGQRFGAVRDALAQRCGLDPHDASVAWQTLMRWLLEFLPTNYEADTPRHSEIMYRVHPEVASDGDADKISR